MTQQGQRQARWRQWAGSSSTYNGDLIGAGQAASGLTGLTYNEALMYCLRAITGSGSDMARCLRALLAVTA